MTLKSGVQFVPPPPLIVSDLRKSIDTALASLKSGERGAIVLVATADGGTVTLNAAVVAKIGETWAIQSWVGKRYGGEVVGGATVMKTW